MKTTASLSWEALSDAILIYLATTGFKGFKAKMYFPSPPSSPEKQVESPEYMDIEGFEGFFQETNERRIVEFADFILDSDDFDKVDGKDDSFAGDKAEVLQEDGGDEELLLLQEILNFKGQDEVQRNMSSFSS